MKGRSLRHFRVAMAPCIAEGGVLRGIRCPPLRYVVTGRVLGLGLLIWRVVLGPAISWDWGHESKLQVSFLPELGIGLLKAVGVLGLSLSADPAPIVQPQAAPDASGQIMLADGSQCDPPRASPGGGASPISCISYQPSGPRFGSGGVTLDTAPTYKSDCSS